MVSTSPSVTDRSVALKSSGIRLTGTAQAPASGMKARDEQQLKVDSRSEGRYNIKLDRPNAAYEVVDNRDRVVLYGRNGSVLRPQGVYLSAGDYRVRVTDDDPTVKSRDYAVDLTPRAPDTAAVISSAGGKITGKTEGEGFRGLPSDSKLMRVDVAGEYNVRINTPLTSFEIRNSRGEVIASGRNNLDPESVKVRLSPSDTYTVTTLQTLPSSFGRSYEIDIAPRINANIVGQGGMVMGNMPAVPAGMSNKQSHTVNFLGGGDFQVNFLAPNAKYSLVDSSGKEVIKGENKAGEVGLPVDAKIEAGSYTLNVELGAGDGSGGNWLLNILRQKDPTVRPELTKIEKLLAERDVRLTNQARGVNTTA